MKWAVYAVLGVLITAGWVWFALKDRDKIAEIEEEIQQIEERGYQNELEEVPSMRDKIADIEGGKTLPGIMMAFLTSGIVGVIFVTDVLPTLAHKLTHAVYDSGEEVDDDPMHDGHAMFAQGDYEGAIAAFRDAAAEDPLNRLPYVEIAKIQRTYLHDPGLAVQTLRDALEQQEWEISDAAFLMFRLAEVYDEGLSDRGSAAAIMQQVVEQFPETRHSANARHKLHEWEQV